MILESGSQKIEVLVYDTLRNIFSNPVSGATLLITPLYTDFLTDLFIHCAKLSLFLIDVVL